MRSGRPSVVSFDQPPRVVNPFVGTVRHPQPEIATVEFAFTGKVGRHEAVDIFQVIRMQAVKKTPRIGAKGPGRVSQHRAEAVVHIDGVGRDIPVPSPHIGTGDDGRQLVTRLAYLFFRLLALRQVLDERKKPPHPIHLGDRERT